jgi:zinc/manganese transport system permease protein
VETLTLWLWPFAALILLPGLLVYLGLHVVERGVIFVDLALAQVAALGVAVAVLVGSEPAHSFFPWVMALLFTLIGATVFAWTRFRDGRVPQEAFIGIVYIVAAAGSVLVLSKTPAGDDEIKNLLVGNILLVGRGTVLGTFVLYLGLGLFHFVFRRRFLEISFDLQAAAGRGVRLRLWDFLFYASFGLAVTSFVQMAGVYLAFSYLIVPAVCAALLVRGVAARLVVGWGVALAAGLCGLILSTEWTSMDLPTGPTIVCVFGVALLLSGIAAALRPRILGPAPRTGRA